MLTQWCLGVGWPFDLPSCLLCPCQTWAVILQCFSWDKECCWIHWCMSSPCITRYPAKILLCSLWVFQELQNLHTYKPVFFFLSKFRFSGLLRKILQWLPSVCIHCSLVWLSPVCLSTGCQGNLSSHRDYNLFPGQIHSLCPLNIFLLPHLSDLHLVQSLSLPWLLLLWWCWWKKILHLILGYHPISFLLL